MTNLRHLPATLLLAAVVAVPSCSSDEDADASGKPIVFVSVLPQAYLAERVAGEHMEVDVLVGPGQNPHMYAPTPKQMVRLSKAEVFFRVGVPFEQALLPKLAANRQLRIVDTRRDIRLLAAGEHGHEHEGDLHPKTKPTHEEHRKHREHHGEDLDPHVWMSPRLAKVMARTMCETLVEIDPAHKADYRQNVKRLQADLDTLDKEIAAALAPLRGRTFYVFHPAFGYFARDYGLVQEAVETGGKSPGARHVKELIDKARAEGVRVIFVQPQFSELAARKIAERIDGAVVPIDPLAKGYIANLRDVARKIRRALSPATRPADAS